ncbi:unnamed protein product [Ambrosiozyma monospora]|uniref:Unnamed protein product n=1 Tax=Ambrosiozyma monospora TaxID=43982 RepID=A0A9W6WGM3_AMBMO|nr:unnamed protein product [Ambrosiozyma monospora]
MVVDYSKWDKIELSDDSDIEVHPNVDKASFIRWKQRDIHEKRIQRDNEIKGLNIQREMYTHLNKRVDSMLSTLNDDQLSSEKARNLFLSDKFDKNERCTIEDQNDAPTYNEMVEDLFTQITEDLEKEGKDSKDADLLKQKLAEHRKKIDTVLVQIGPKLKKLEEEKHLHISSEDIHDGWNSSIINKSTASETSAPKKAGKTTTQTTTTVETLNTPKKKNVQTPSKPLDQLDELEALEETIEFSKIPSDQLIKSAKFLENHLYIVSEQQKDALMMTSFESQLAGDSKRTKQIIFQALIIHNWYVH